MRQSARSTSRNGRRAHTAPTRALSARLLHALQSRAAEPPRAVDPPIALDTLREAMDPAVFERVFTDDQLKRYEKGEKHFFVSVTRGGARYDSALYWGASHDQPIGRCRSPVRCGRAVL